MGSVNAFIKKNRLNYVGISIILIIAVSLGMMFLELNQQISSSIHNVKKETNVEDFSFYPSLSSDEIAGIMSFDDYTSALKQKSDDLSKKYDFTYECHEYKISKNDDDIVRFYKEGRTIDELYVVDGENKLSDGCVMIDYGYADYHNLSVGDKITANNKDYKIAGIVLYPDKLAPIVDNTGMPYNRDSQVILTLNDSDYDKLDNLSENYEFAGKSGDNFNIDDLKDDSSIYTLTAAEDNPQVLKTIESKSKINSIILYFAMTILFSIAALILVMTILSSISSEASRLGVMKALGFTNYEVSRKYFLFFPMIFLPCVIGYGLGYFLIPFFSRIILNDMAIPISRENVNYTIAAILVFAPAVVFSILAYIVAVIKVRKPALELIRSGGKKRENKIVQRINKHITTKNYIKGIRKTVLYSKLLVLVFVVFGGFALGVQIQFALTMYNMTGNLSSGIMDGVKYDNAVQYIQTVDEADITAEDMLFNKQSVKLDNIHDDSYVADLCVLKNDGADLLELTDKNGNTINKRNVDGVIINDWMRVHYDLEKGDKIVIHIGKSEYETSVAEVSKNIYGNVIYTNMNYAQKSGILSEETYNGLYTNRDVEFNSQKHLSITSTDEIIRSVESSSEIYNILSAFFLITGIVIGLAMLVLSMNTVIKNYQKYISLMKILGYSESECGKVIKGFRTASIIGYIVSIPYTYLLCFIMFKIISESSDVIYKVKFDIPSTVICFVVTAIITEIVMAVFLSQIRKISFRIIMDS